MEIKIEDLKKDQELFIANIERMNKLDKLKDMLIKARQAYLDSVIVIKRNAKMILEEAHYDVTHAYEGRQAVNNHILLKDGYDCILVQRDLPLINAIELTKLEISQLNP